MACAEIAGRTNAYASRGLFCYQLEIADCANFFVSSSSASIGTYGYVRLCTVENQTCAGGTSYACALPPAPPVPPLTPPSAPPSPYPPSSPAWPPAPSLPPLVPPHELGSRPPALNAMMHNGFWHPDGVGALLRRISSATKIAVVGSSGNLLYRNHGHEIDAAKLVIRINGAITEGYENDVGHSTDIRVGWRTGMEDAKRTAGALDANQTLVMTCTNSRQCHWITGEEQSYHVRDTLVIDDSWVASLHAGTLGNTGSWPSTGFIALAMAVALASHVGARAPSVYGFGACIGCAKYYDCDGSNSSKAERFGVAKEAQGDNWYHPFAAEAIVRARWWHLGVIELFETSCEGFASHYAGTPSMPPPPPSIPLPLALPSVPPPLPPAAPFGTKCLEWCPGHPAAWASKCLFHACSGCTLHCVSVSAPDAPLAHAAPSMRLSAPEMVPANPLAPPSLLVQYPSPPAVQQTLRTPVTTPLAPPPWADGQPARVDNDCTAKLVVAALAGAFIGATLARVCHCSRPSCLFQTSLQGGRHAASYVSRRMVRACCVSTADSESDMHGAAGAAMNVQLNDAALAARRLSASFPS